MSEPLVVTVALPEEELMKKFQSEEIIKSLGLTWMGANYEFGEIYMYAMEDRKEYVFEMKTVEEKINPQNYYGIPICGTWNGAICFEELQDQILEAKKLFKKITGLEGRLYVIGSQN